MASPYETLLQAKPPPEEETPVEISPSAVDSEPKKPTVEEVVKMALNTPYKLTPGHPIETPIGTWHMRGKIVIFDVHIDIPQEKVIYPHVEDINAYVADIFEAKASKKTAVRKPLTGFRKAAALGIALLGDV